MSGRVAEWDFLEALLPSVYEAGRVVIELLRTPLALRRKDDNSLVTEADMRSDALLREAILTRFSGHAVLSEETGLQGNTGSEYVWLIDPLDGTKAYAQGKVGFCIMVGLLKSGLPRLGIVFDPLEGHCYQAVRGAGVQCVSGGVRTLLKVSARRDAAQMPVVVSTGFPEKWLEQIRLDRSAPFLAPIHSVGIKVGLLVRQEADVYINHHSVHYWDTCAPQVILEEAGGIFTRLDGTPLRYSLQAPFSHEAKTLASNGTRHEDWVKYLSLRLTEGAS